MKKFILMLALFSAVLSANAQIATENSNALDNIGVGITAGASTPLDFNSVFPLNPTLGLRVQKDFTPIFGVQLEGLAILNDNHFSDINTMVKATNVGLNGAFNLSNIFCGYKGSPRTFEVSAVGGIGWMHMWNTSFNYFTSKTGLDLAFNLGKKKAHSLVLTPAIYWNLNKFNDIKFNKHGSQLALNLSYIYHFKTSNGTHHFKTYDIGAMNDEINNLRGALEECEKREPKVIEKAIIKEVLVKDTTSTSNTADEDIQWTVPFELGKAEITVEGAFILKQISENMVVDIVATASPIGTKEFNQKLSEKRAEAVANWLKNHGVKVKSAVGKGVDPVSGKTAVVTLAK